MGLFQCLSPVFNHVSIATAPPNYLYLSAPCWNYFPFIWQLISVSDSHRFIDHAQLGILSAGWWGQGLIEYFLQRFDNWELGAQPLSEWWLLKVGNTVFHHSNVWKRIDFFHLKSIFSTDSNGALKLLPTWNIAAALTSKRWNPEKTSRSPKKPLFGSYLRNLKKACSSVESSTTQ